MMREYSITALLGSVSPKNTAEPSIAGVKNGRPAITSTTRNQSATAPAPMSPAMNPSRRIRVSCMTQYRFHPGLAPGVSIGRMSLPRRLVYSVCLLAGSVLAVAAGALHPDIAGQDGPSQLAVIAQSRAWPAIHWAFLFSFPLALLGLVGVVGRHVGTAGESATRAGVLLATLAYALWVIIVAFMGGAGWALARSFATSDAGMTATRAVFVFDMLRPFALDAQRVAGFALGLATALFGWGMLDGKALPRWLGAAAVAAGVAGVVAAPRLPGGTQADEAAVVLPPVVEVADPGGVVRAG